MSTKHLSTFSLAMLTVAAIVSLRNFPMSASFGLSSVVFFIVAGLVYLIPIALVSAELATSWPRPGGNYVWVSEAFGKPSGFFALWSAWMESIAWFPSILIFIAKMFAISLAPIFPNCLDSKLFHFVAIIVIFWGATYLNFFGLKLSSLITNVGVFLGTIIPGCLIIGLSIFWLKSGNAIHLDLTWSALWPEFKLDSWVLFSGVLLGLSGVEIAAFHIKDAVNPQTDYPKSLSIAVSLILILSILGSLAIAIVVPKDEINLVSGIMQAFAAFFKHLNLEAITPWIAGILALGSLAGVNAWTLGPAKGLLVVAQDGFLPAKLTKVNKHGTPCNLLILQAGIGTLLATVFLFFDDQSAGFWLLTALASQFTVIQYAMTICAAVKLRWSQIHTPRPYKIPGGQLGLIIICGAGLVACLFGFAIVFIVPEQLKASLSSSTCIGFLLLSLIVLLLPPLLLSKKLKIGANC